MTERLYETDATLLSFAATVTAATPLSGGAFAVELDRTAFYPGGGGQPHDRGMLDGTEVFEVREEDGRILHLTRAPLPPGPVRGEVDRARRLDLMRQHTGQHLLSAAFHGRFGAATVGFHLGETECTIDLPLPELTAAQAEEAEALANSFILEPRPVVAHITDAAGARRFPLRKFPKERFERIRLIEIPGADCCPCGGTHLPTTGAVGLVKIVSLTRRGAETRVAFLCGERAISDYGKRIAVTAGLGAALSVPPERLPDAVAGLLARVEALERSLRRGEAERIALLAAASAAAAAPLGPFVVARARLDGAEAQAVADLANAIAARGSLVALAGGVSADGAKAHLAFAASAALDAPLDVAALLRAALPAVDGRGGGTPRFARGGGGRPAGLEEALDIAAETLRRTPPARIPPPDPLD